MRYLQKHKVVSSFVAFLLIALPIIVLASMKNQDTRGRAQASTTLYFSPVTSATSPLQKTVGNSFSLDLMLSPGTNLVTFTKIEILFDPTKLTLDTTNPLVVNTAVFPQIVEGPVYGSGKIDIVLSVGPDLSKAVGQNSKILTLNFKAVSPVSQTLVSFGTITQILSAAYQDNSSENVLSTTSPAIIKISRLKGGGTVGKKH